MRKIEEVVKSFIYYDLYTYAITDMYVLALHCVYSLRQCCSIFGAYNRSSLRRTSVICLLT